MVRDGQNIRSECSISLLDAILGKSINIDTLDGEKEIKINPGTQDNHEIFLQKKGVKPFNPPDGYDPEDLRGDHIVKIKVKLPKPGELSDHQKTLF